MASVVAGIDPHQDNFTVGIVDSVGVEITRASFDNNAPGYVAAIELLTNHEVSQVGIEGSASWGAHVAIALVAAGFDAREVPPQRTAQQRRSRRHDKTDNTDAIATARAVLAEPTLGPVQTLEVYDSLVAKIEAVLEHRRMLVALRTLAIHHIADQIAKLPTEIRDQLGSYGKVSSRLRRLTRIDTTVATTWRADTGSTGSSSGSPRTGPGRPRSSASKATSIGSSTNTAPRCAKNQASDRSTRDPRRRSRRRDTLRDRIQVRSLVRHRRGRALLR